MRFVRILFSVLLVFVGLVAALFLMLLGRLFGRAGSRPAMNVRFHRTGQRPSSTPPPVHGDVIDIEATPVKD